MAGPPDTIKPADLWSKLQEMPRPSRVVDFPRKGEDGEPIGQLRIWVLTQEEQIASSAAAETFTKKLLKEGKTGELGYEAVYSNAACVEMLHRACRHVDDLTRPAFPSPSDLRSKLGANEVSALMDHYLTIQLELGPIVTHMSDGELDAWIARIVEGGSAFPFDLLSRDLQTVLVLYMARRLVSSSTDTSSSGSPPEEPPPTGESETPQEADASA